MRRAATAVTVCLATLLASCGGDDTKAPDPQADRAAVTNVVDRYVDSFVAGRGGAACSAYTPALKRRIDQNARYKDLGSCEEAITAAARELRARQPASVRKQARAILTARRNIRVRVRGDRAVAALALGSNDPTLSRTRLILRRQGSTWKISQVGANVRF